MALTNWQCRRLSQQLMNLECMMESDCETSPVPQCPTAADESNRKQKRLEITENTPGSRSTNTPAMSDATPLQIQHVSVVFCFTKNCATTSILLSTTLPLLFTSV